MGPVIASASMSLDGRGRHTMDGPVVVVTRQVPLDDAAVDQSSDG